MLWSQSFFSIKGRVSAWTISYVSDLLVLQEWTGSVRCTKCFFRYLLLSKFPLIHCCNKELIMFASNLTYCCLGSKLDGSFKSFAVSLEKVINCIEEFLRDVDIKYWSSLFWFLFFDLLKSRPSLSLLSSESSR